MDDPPLTRKAYEPHEGSTFTISVEGEEAVELQMVEVADKTPASVPGEQFSLLFSGPMDRPLQQRLYPVDHTELGHFMLFLVPVGIRKDQRLYESFFNRLAADED